MKSNIILSSIFSILCCSVTAQTYPYQNPELTPYERACDLVKHLTLEEKAKLMWMIQSQYLVWESEGSIGRVKHYTEWLIKEMLQSFRSLLV